jgi:hypothetical protein
MPNGCNLCRIATPPTTSTKNLQIGHHAVALVLVDEQEIIPVRALLWLCPESKSDSFASRSIDPIMAALVRGDAPRIVSGQSAG